MHSLADQMCMCSAAQLTQSVRPLPHMEKNKLILSEYLGIFMHFESIFFNLENGIFQTHPPTKSGKFQIFFETFPNDHKKRKKIDWNIFQLLSTYKFRWVSKIIPPYCSKIRKKRKKETLYVTWLNSNLCYDYWSFIEQSKLYKNCYYTLKWTIDWASYDQNVRGHLN